MGRRALSAELKAEVDNMKRKVNTAEELAEFLQKSLDTEREKTRVLSNEVSKNKQVAEVQMKRKTEEIKALNEQISKASETGKKQMDEMRVMYMERDDKLKETIMKLKVYATAHTKDTHSKESDTETHRERERERVQGVCQHLFKNILSYPQKTQTERDETNGRERQRETERY